MTEHDVLLCCICFSVHGWVIVEDPPWPLATILLLLQVHLDADLESVVQQAALKGKDNEGMEEGSCWNSHVYNTILCHNLVIILLSLSVVMFISASWYYSGTSLPWTSLGPFHMSRISSVCILADSSIYLVEFVITIRHMMVDFCGSSLGSLSYCEVCIHLFSA